MAVATLDRTEDADRRTIFLPNPQEHQHDLIYSDRRWKCAVCGRRWGKSTSGLIMCIEGHGPTIEAGSHHTLTNATRKFPGALEGARIWWIVPVYKNALPLWRGLKRVVKPLLRRGPRGAPPIARKDEQERMVEFESGGYVQIRTGDDPESLVAEGLDGAVIDEAGKMKPEVWDNVRPALMDRRGWAVLIGTPKGLNWFHDKFQEARRDPQRWFHIQQSSRANPKVTDEELEEVAKDMGPVERAQEIDAQFIVAGAGLFQPEWMRRWTVEYDAQGVELVVLDDGVRPRRSFLFSALTRFITIDPALSEKQEADYTAISTWALTPDNDLLLLRTLTKKLGAPELLTTLKTEFRENGASYIACERRAIELMLIQQGAREGLPIKPIGTGNDDKVQRSSPAQARMEQGKVWFPEAGYPYVGNLDEAELELWAFPTENIHDDFVDTLSLAVIDSTRMETVAVGAVSLEQPNPWTVR